MSVVSLVNVSRLYRQGGATTAALADVSFEADPGETIALVGSSGSGKTTLLNVAAGLDTPTSGQVRLMGRDLSELSETQLARLRRRQVGFVFQTLNLLPSLTGAENIELSLALAGWTKADRRARSAELLARADLADRANRLPDQMSTGQQQRIAALRAISHKPDLVILDEPTSCLDDANAEALLDLLIELNESAGSAMILATHDLQAAGRMGRTVNLHDGRTTDGL